MKAAEAPAQYKQQMPPTAPYSGTFAYTRRNARQPTDSNTSRENVHGRQTTYLFPDKLGKAPLSHKQDQRPRARRYLYRQPDAKHTGKRENRHRKVLALFLRRFSFYCARGKLVSFPPGFMRKYHHGHSQQTSQTGVQRMKSSGARYRGRRAPCLV